jgi:hypothetical protein
MKVCRKCGIEKNESDYYKRIKGYENICKKCRSTQTMVFRRNDSTYRKRHNEQAKSYRDRDVNKKKIKQRKSKYYLENKESIKEYLIKYYSDEVNRKRKIKTNYNRNRQRIKSDPLYTFSYSIREMIRNSFKRNRFIKESITEKIIGCSFDQLKIYLESRFESWMTWENRGLYNGELNYGWDIDHIIPISVAENSMELIKLNHYTNLQPLCSKINRDIKKNNILWQKM